MKLIHLLAVLAALPGPSAQAGESAEAHRRLECQAAKARYLVSAADKAAGACSTIELELFQLRSDPAMLMTLEPTAAGPAPARKPLTDRQACATAKTLVENRPMTEVGKTACSELELGLFLHGTVRTN
ncbi:MAG TPA: hypothetical protein VGE47_16880 [Burkholderiaceae bacterium]